MTQESGLAAAIVYFGEGPWYGGGYCGVCGSRDAAELIARPTRYWDCDDGWQIGILCVSCTADMRAPDPSDYAFKRHYSDWQIFDALADLLGDDADGLWSEAQDLAQD